MLISTKTLSLFLCLLVALTGCSSFSQTSRQERAYRKYVQKQSLQRAKQQAKFTRESTKIPKLPPSTGSVAAGPVSMTAGTSE